MSIDPKKFGLSDSLVSAVSEALKGNQHKIDVAEPKGKITGADFKKLRGEGAKPDYIDLDKDGNKKEPMKLAAKQVKEEVEVTEAEDAVAKQIAAKKDAMKKQIRQKIAQKQMSVMQQKAQKKMQTIKAGNDKCSCDSTNESKMKCEVHGGKDAKLGKEPIEVNPPLKEASNLPKSVIKKGHEIAKSLIKHKSSVREPYAVGMAAAKKSAGIKEETEFDEAAGYKYKGPGFKSEKTPPIGKEGSKRNRHISDIRELLAQIDPKKPISNDHHAKIINKLNKLKEETEQIDERNIENKAKKDAAVAAIGSKHKDDQYLSKMRTSVANKIRGREITQGKDRQQFKEDAEQVDEISAMKAMKTAVKRQTNAYGDAIMRGDDLSDKEKHKVNRSQALIKKKYGEKGDKIVYKAVGKRIGYQD